MVPTFSKPVGPCVPTVVGDGLVSIHASVRVTTCSPHWIGGVKMTEPLLFLKNTKQKRILLAFYENITGRNSGGKIIK
jgi:hypothetical protein